MTKKPWTPDNCPVQAGMCVHDTLNNVDVLVTRRYLDWDDCRDDDKPLLQLGGTTTFTGRELLESNFTYYPEWPCTLDEKPCYHEEDDKPLYPVLVGAIHDALVKSHYAKEGVHYTMENGIRIWEDYLVTAVNNVADHLDLVFKELKHDEQ
jgi:hypothetical protein